MLGCNHNEVCMSTTREASTSKSQPTSPQLCCLCQCVLTTPLTLLKTCAQVTQVFATSWALRRDKKTRTRSHEHPITFVTCETKFTIHIGGAERAERCVQHDERVEEPRQLDPRQRQVPSVQRGSSVPRGMGTTNSSAAQGLHYVGEQRKFKNGLRGQAWILTDKVKEMAVTRLTEPIAADDTGSLREVICVVRKSSAAPTDWTTHVRQIRERKLRVVEKEPTLTRVGPGKTCQN